MAWYIDNPKKVIFIHTPKTAGISVEDWLLKNFNPIRIKRLHSPYRDCIDEVPNNTISFSVCRNPWDRMISYYYFTIKFQNNRLEKIKREGPPKRYANKLKWNLDFLLSNKKEFDKGFDYFIKNKNLWKDGFVACNTIQSQIIGNCDIVLRFEKLEEDFKQIQELLDCDVPLGHRNKTNHLDRKSLYTQETKKIVEEYFKEDIKKYNYSYE